MSRFARTRAAAGRRPARVGDAVIVFRAPGEVPDGFGPSVVAIGKFDGVHAGHRAVIEHARVDAASTGAKVVAVTFDRNPLRTLRPEMCPDDLVGATQKLRLLDEAGVDGTVMLRFDEELAALSARAFVETLLVGALDATTVLVGRDFRFGSGGAGDPQLLIEMGESCGFRVDVVDNIRSLDGGRRVSSTWIRELLADGAVEAAGRLLGRPPSVWGEVVHGHGEGRIRGFPTATLSPDLEGFVPAAGVYAGWLTDEGVGMRSGTRYPAAVAVGDVPAAGAVVPAVGAHVLDEERLDLSGHRVEVQFTRRIRGPGDIGAGRAWTEEDVDRVRAALT